MRDFAAIIDAFGGYARFAQVVGIEKLGTVSAWKTRNSIPAAYWRRIATAAHNNGIAGATIEDLAAAAANRKVLKSFSGGAVLRKRDGAG